MSLLASLLAQFALGALQHREHSKPKWVCGLGILFLILGSVFGGYFLFQLAVPQLGYIETGLIFSGIFILIGVSLMVFKPKKKPEAIPQMLTNAKNAVEEIDVPAIFQKHSGKIILGTIVSGMILSQLIPTKGDSFLKKYLG